MMKKTALSLSITTALLTACGGGGGGSAGGDDNNTGGPTVPRKTMMLAMDNGTSGMEPWITDGTAEGTKIFKNLRAAGMGSYPAHFVEMNGKTYFSASYADSTGSVQNRLWETDGTPEGTQVVSTKMDVHNEQSLVVFKDKLYFTARNLTDGYELWVSDGTDNGTDMVKNINPSRDGLPQSLTVVNDQLFFTAYDGTHGQELWVSDGTEGGTNMVKDIAPPGYSSSVSQLTAMGGKLYFVASDAITDGAELWVSDGTDNGTHMVKNINTNGNAGSEPKGLKVINDKLYFGANNGTDGAEPWVSDGTEAGTKQLKNIATGSNATGYSDPTNFTELNGKVYFLVTLFAANNTRHAELWVTDGDNDTHMIKQLDSGFRINPYIDNSMVVFDDMITSNGKLYFTDSSDTSGNNKHLWVSDGTQAGTKKIQTPGVSAYSLVKQLGGGITSSNELMANAKGLNEVLLFAYTPSENWELYKLNTQKDSVSLVKDVWAGAQSGVLGSAL